MIVSFFRFLLQELLVPQVSKETEDSQEQLEVVAAL